MGNGSRHEDVAIEQMWSKQANELRSEMAFENQSEMELVKTLTL